MCGVSQERICWNQIGAYHNYFCEGSDAFPLMAGFPGEPGTPALGDVLSEQASAPAAARGRAVSHLVRMGFDSLDDVRSRLQPSGRQVGS